MLDDTVRKSNIKTLVWKWQLASIGGYEVELTVTLDQIVREPVRVQEGDSGGDLKIIPKPGLPPTSNIRICGVGWITSLNSLNLRLRNGLWKKP
jgi:hypothetical protein